MRRGIIELYKCDHKLKSSFLLLVTLLSRIGYSQTNQFSLQQIDSIVHTIDSAKGLTNAVVHGKLSLKNKRKPKGGFSDIYYIKESNRKLLKVERGEKLYFLNFTVFYFFENNLIFVKTRRKSKPGNSIEMISEGKYYFQNDILIEKQESNKPLSKPENFLIQAKMYLKTVDSVFDF